MHPLDHHRHFSTEQHLSGQSQSWFNREPKPTVFPGLSGALVRPLRRGATTALALLAQVARRSGAVQHDHSPCMAL